MEARRARERERESEIEWNSLSHCSLSVAAFTLLRPHRTIRSHHAAQHSTAQRATCELRNSELRREERNRPRRLPGHCSLSTSRRCTRF